MAEVSAWWVLCGTGEHDAVWCGPLDEEGATVHLEGADARCTNHHFHRKVFGAVDPAKVRLMCDFRNKPMPRRDGSWQKIEVEVK